MARGLSDEDLSGLRQQVDDGKRPRVQLSGPHFPAGATGTVVRVGRPEIDGQDYLRVRVKVDNMTDELAFGPSELKLPGRPGKAGARKATAKAVATKAPTRASSARTSSAGTGPVPATSSPPSEPLIEPAPAKPTRRPRPTAAPATAIPAKAGPTTTGPTKAGRRKLGPAQKVTFTVASAGAAWSLTATRGSKNVAKNVGLPPGVVGALAELLDQPALSEAVAEINDAALAEAQQRADQLRAELSQLEAELASHSRP